MSESLLSKDLVRIEISNTEFVKQLSTIKENTPKPKPKPCERWFVLECPPGTYGEGAWMRQDYDCETGELLGGEIWDFGCEEFPIHWI